MDLMTIKMDTMNFPRLLEPLQKKKKNDQKSPVFCLLGMESNV